jgi:multiple sugar transport system ATP-binding protein
MASVEFRHVWKIYGGTVEAVIDTSWKCEDGEFFSILGPSGCGKSSSMRMIAGLEHISRGEILFNDKVINPLPPAERNVAMVFENWALYPNLSVYENIAFPLRVRKMPKDIIDKKVKEAAAFLNLDAILHSGVRRLSGGEMQRVSIGRAIVRNPEVLIMDEPISHLDAALRARMRDELKTQVERLGVTTLYITHDQVEAMAMANRIAIMNLGRIQQIGSPLDIYYNPLNDFVAGFIGEPPMNFSCCEIQKEGGQYKIESPSFQFVLNDRLKSLFNGYKGNSKLKLGVRPEDVQVSLTPSENSFGLEVDFVEPQGDRTIISLRLQSGEIFLAEILGDFRPAIKQNVFVSFDQRHLNFFDVESGTNIFFEEKREPRGD